MSFPRVLLGLVVLLLAGPSCFAQSEQTESTPRIKYHVEVIAFQYRGPDTSGGEQVDRLLVEEYLPRPSFDINEYNRVQENVSYTNITRLGSALERLRASPQYSVLAASAWVQPLLSQNEAVEVPLGDTAAPAAGSSQASSRTSASPQLTGSVRIYGDVLLFVDMELRATLPRRALSRAASGQSSGSTTGSSGFGSTRRPGRFETFQISEKRRIKLEEVHYFDHPYIGAVLSVTRYQGG